MTVPLTPLTDEQFETISRDVFLCDFSRADFLSVIAYARLHRAELAKARVVVERLREALAHIEEYWNRGENDRAMQDALYHMIETARAALAPEGKEGAG